MRKGNRFILFLLATFVVFIITVGTAGLKINAVMGEDIKTHHKKEHAPIRSLMFILSSHTSSILDAIMIGDYDSVQKEATIVADKTKGLMSSFFPQGEKAGEWINETGIDPNNEKHLKSVKEDIGKYVHKIIDSANNIAQASRKHSIVDTYNEFDSMLRETCFKCHETYRSKWPDWPEWMQISGG